MVNNNEQSYIFCRASLKWSTLTTAKVANHETTFAPVCHNHTQVCFCPSQNTHLLLSQSTGSMSVISSMALRNHLPSVCLSVHFSFVFSSLPRCKVYRLRSALFASFLSLSSILEYVNLLRSDLEVPSRSFKGGYSSAEADCTTIVYSYIYMYILVTVDFVFFLSVRTLTLICVYVWITSELYFPAELCIHMCFKGSHRILNDCIFSESVVVYGSDFCNANDNSVQYPTHILSGRSVLYSRSRRLSWWDFCFSLYLQTTIWGRAEGITQRWTAPWSWDRIPLGFHICGWVGPESFRSFY